MKRLTMLMATVILALASPLSAATIVGDTSGAGSSRLAFFWGQSFTTPTGGPWTDITFNFYDLTGTAYAAGTGYIFAAAYSGTPANLATGGALAVSAPANGSVYSFSPSYSLNAGTQYFFYEDAAMRLLGGGTANVGGTSVFTQFGTGAFASAGGLNANFRVAGNVAAVPEPASWAILVIGFAAIGATVRRLRTAGSRMRQA